MCYLFLMLYVPGGHAGFIGNTLFGYRQCKVYKIHGKDQDKGDATTRECTYTPSSVETTPCLV